MERSPVWADIAIKIILFLVLFGIPYWLQKREERQQLLQKEKQRGRLARRRVLRRKQPLRERRPRRRLNARKQQLQDGLVKRRKQFASILGKLEGLEQIGSINEVLKKVGESLEETINACEILQELLNEEEKVVVVVDGTGGPR